MVFVIDDVDFAKGLLRLVPVRLKRGRGKAGLFNLRLPIQERVCQWLLGKNSRKTHGVDNYSYKSLAWDKISL